MLARSPASRRAGPRWLDNSGETGADELLPPARLNSRSLRLSSSLKGKDAGDAVKGGVCVDGEGPSDAPSLPGGMDATVGLGGGEGEDGREGEAGGEEERVSVLVATWNLGGKPCPDVSLAPWLRPDEFDIYVVGAQEVEAAPGMSTATQRPKWEAKVTSTIGAQYDLVAKHCLGTTHIMCFVRKELMPHVSDVHHAHVITGFGRVVANKAGVAVCFDLYSTSFLFVTAHFAAGTKAAHVKARNADYDRIDSALVPLMCPALALTRVPIAPRDLRAQRPVADEGALSGQAGEKLSDIAT